MKSEPATYFVVAALMLLPACLRGASQADDGTRLAPLYAQQVNRRLDLPDDEQQNYAKLIAENLTSDECDRAQYVVLVDRNPFVQASMIYWMSPDHVFHFIGASPVSTGKPGKFERFITPTGVFEHTVDHPDYRADGTRNHFGIRGYGVKGMRVYDFGWQKAERGWGRGGIGKLRLQMHATDPDLLAWKLGSPQSEGCIRIPATLNTFIDHYGILDGDYEKAIAAGKKFSVISQTRDATPWSGKFLVIVDTGRTERPDWSPPPQRPAHEKRTSARETRINRRKISENNRKL